MLNKDSLLSLQARGQESWGHSKGLYATDLNPHCSQGLARKTTSTLGRLAENS